jgi:general secretion pathway protein F
MATYLYQYLSKSGRKRRGIVDASTEAEAKAKLRAQGLLVTRLALQGRGRGRRHLSGQGLLNFTLQLGQLLRAGIPVYESLSALEEQYRGEKIHPILVQICEEIKSGASLSTALRHHPQSFNELYCSMVAAGESAGALELVLDRLATLLTRQMKLRRQISTALIYPAVIASFCCLVVFLLLTFAIPSIENLFEGRQLGTFTALVLGTSHLLSRTWMIYLPALIGGLFFLRWYLRSPKGSAAAHRVSLRLPLVRTIVVQAALARFSRTLSTLLSGGLPMIDSLRLASRVITNPTLSDTLSRAETRIVEGSSLSQELQKEPLIPKLVARMVRVGEEAGTLTPMLEQVADLYEGEVEKSVQRLTTLAQPAVLLVMGAIVGVIMLAVLLPLTDVSSFF